MINSENLIIANSSFSWWAANIRAVAGFDDTRVCSPKKFGFPKLLGHLLTLNQKFQKTGNKFQTLLIIVVRLMIIY